LEYLRNALILKSADSKLLTGVVQLNEEQIKKLSGYLNEIETHQIVSLIDKCSSYIKELKLTTNPKLWLDVAILDMANLTENTKLENIQARLQQLESGQAVKPAHVYNTPPMPVNKMVEKKEESKLAKQEPVAQVTATSKEASEITKPVINVSSKSDNTELKNLWIKFLDNIQTFASRAILKQYAKPVKLTQEEVIIAIKSDSWLNRFRDEADRMALLEAASVAVLGAKPKIVLRKPNADDDKLAVESLPSEPEPEPATKKKLIPDKNEPEEVVKDAIEQSEEVISDINASPDKVSQNHSAQREDAGFHSDNVNMVIDLFDGKIIE
jgi:DNA polymerase-3 subunit gamma/tau